MFLQILSYWLVIHLFGLAALPVAALLFRSLPDRGYAFAMPLGLLLVGWAAWFSAMLGLVPFGRALIISLIVLLALGGWLGLRRFGGRADLAALGRQWPTLLGYELLFVAALVFAAWMRSYQPDPWGTERPMDFAFFNAIRRGGSFPPEDPWLAGHSINYYYLGYLLMATVSLLSGLSPAVAYNLSLALLFGLAAVGVAGIVLNLVRLVTGESWDVQTSGRVRQPVPAANPPQGADESLLLILDRGSGPMQQAEAEPPQRPSAPLSEAASPSISGEPRLSADAAGAEPITAATPALRQRILSALRSSTARAWGCALFAVISVLVAGNQAGATQVITGNEQAVVLDTRQLLSALGQGLMGATTIQLPYATPPINEFNAPEGLRYWERRDMVAEFNDWWPSRALWDDIGTPPDVERRYAITEFPFFSFWLGDMHPHVMSLPFTLLALALALATLARPAAPAFGENRRGWLELALTGLVLGGLYMINSWDLPTYLLLYAGALLLLYVRLAAGRPLLWQQFGRNLALAVLAAFLLYLPFHLTFRSLVGAKEPLIALPLVGRLTSTLGIFSDDRTALSYFLVIFGLFLVPLLAFMLGQGGGRSQRTPLGITSVRDASTLRSWLSEITLVATFIAFGLGLGIDFPLLVLLPLGLFATWTALRASNELGILNAGFKRSGEPDPADDTAGSTMFGVRGPGLRRAAPPVQNSPGVSFALWAAAMGCFICFGTELIYIRDVFEGWQPRFNTIFKFYYQTWLLWGTLAGFALWWVLTYTRRAIALSIAALTLILLVGGLVYPALTAGKLPSRDDRKGLQGTTPREASPEGRAAIAWLRANAPLGAVVLEAVGGSYNGEGFAGISASTGIPTVIGWPGHQSQWRGGDQQLLDQLGPRENDVRTIYTTGDVELARALLQQYGVTHIYVGDQERQAYGVEGEAKFASLGEPVFQQGGVTIYKVR